MALVFEPLDADFEAFRLAPPTFADGLASLLKGMHKGTAHVGKVPARQAKSLERESQLVEVAVGPRGFRHHAPNIARRGGVVRTPLPTLAGRARLDPSWRRTPWFERAGW